MARRPFSKPHADTAAIIRHLEDKGLVVGDRDAASRLIERLGYAHLRYYLLSRRDQPDRSFRPETKFEDIESLCETDARIRDACWSALRKFEMDFRCTVSETMSERFGSHAHLEDAAFADKLTKQSILRRIREAVEMASDDPRIVHYQNTYSSPELPPIWTVKEILTFGALRKLYGGLDANTKGQIAKKYTQVGSIPLFMSWTRNMVIMRNICAHHQMLFAYRFKMQPRVRRRSPQIPTASLFSLKAQLECLDEMLSARGMESRIVSKVGEIVDACPTMEMREAGY